jgi:hypothetical protein
MQAQGGHGVGDLFTKNHQKMEAKIDPLSTHDINGGIKRNQYNAKVYIDE